MLRHVAAVGAAARSLSRPAAGVAYSSKAAGLDTLIITPAAVERLQLINTGGISDAFLPDGVSTGGCFVC